MAGPYEPPKKGNSILEKLGGRPPGRDADSEPDDSVREAFSNRPATDDDLMLDVRLRDGSRCALSYGTLLKVDYNPADELRLAFGVETVVIEGRRLLPLYELLRRHRARYVQEG